MKTKYPNANIKTLYQVLLMYLKPPLLIVYYVPRRIMRVITRRATMVAGDRSQGVAEAKPKQSRDEAEARSVLRAFLASLVITRIVCISTYSILCDFGAYKSFYAYTRIQSEKVEIAVIIAHLT